MRSLDLVARQVVVGEAQTRLAQGGDRRLGVVARLHEAVEELPLGAPLVGIVVAAKRFGRLAGDLGGLLVLAVLQQAARLEQTYAEEIAREGPGEERCGFLDERAAAVGAAEAEPGFAAVVGDAPGLARRQAVGGELGGFVERDQRRLVAAGLDIQAADLGDGRRAVGADAHALAAAAGDVVAGRPLALGAARRARG